jgi:hypothetical protein
MPDQYVEFDAHTRVDDDKQMEDHSAETPRRS